MPDMNETDLVPSYAKCFHDAVHPVTRQAEHNVHSPIHQGFDEDVTTVVVRCTRPWTSVAAGGNHTAGIMADGTLYQTNALATISYHAQKANASSVGIVFAGSFMGVSPTDAQITAGGQLLSYLGQMLGLPRESIRGHKDFVATACPGDQWEGGQTWRDKLLAQVVVAAAR